MDAEARKEEILAKKAKLEELRRARAAREQELRTKRQSVDPGDVLTPTPNRDQRQRDIEKLLTDVLGESRSASPGAVASPRTGSRSRPGSVVSSSRPLSDERRASTQRMSSETGENRESRATGMSVVSSGTTYVASATQTLGITPTVSVYEQPSDAPPKKEIVTYDKGIQTSDDWSAQRKEEGVGAEEAEDEWDGRETPKALSESQKESIRDELRKEIEDEVRAAVQPGSVQPTEEARFPARTLSNDELEAVTTSRDFQDFLDQSTKVIERALDEEYDLLTDYAHGKTNLDADDEGYSTRGKRGRRVRQVAQYWDERWSKKRQISDIGFSPKVCISIPAEVQVTLLMYDHSTPSSSSPPTPRIPQLHTNQLVSSKSGTPTCPPDPNTSSTPPQTSSLPNFRHFTLRS
jgi:dynein intermediate chain